MRGKSGLFAVALALLASAGCRSGAPVVESVPSGDTLRLSDGRVVRCAGVRAPPAGEPGHDEAHQGLAELALGQAVELVWDEPGKTAHVYTRIRDRASAGAGPGEERTRYLSVNRELLLFGLARFEPASLARKDLAEDLRQAEELARAQGLGLWKGRPAAQPGSGEGDVR